MLDPTPQWSYAPQSALTRTYGHVRLHENCALGQWWCIEIDTGRLRWEAPELTPDMVVAVSDGVILATEIRSSGPTTTTAGSWAISLETGELLWRSEGVGLLTFFWLLLRGRLDDVGAEIIGVRDGECACEGGRILDIHSGRELRRERDLSAWRQTLRSADSSSLALGGRMALAGGGTLTAAVIEAPEESGLQIQRFSRDGELCWSFDSREHFGCFPDYLARIESQGDYAYMMVTDAPFAAEAPVSRDWSLCVLDLRSGQLVQRLALSQSSAQDHRIEDLDARYLLWSRGGEQVFAHRCSG